MKFSMNSTKGYNMEHKLGWLIWWTVQDRELAQDLVKEVAQDAGIPDWLVERLNGRTAKSAWLAASQFGAKGRVAAPHGDEPAEARVRYLTREVNAETRLIVREVLRPTEEEANAVSVAKLYFGGGNSTAEVEAGLSPEIDAEVRGLVDEIHEQAKALVGMLDGPRVRTTVGAWLERHHRVTTRGGGGVYFVPNPSDQDESDRIVNELLAITSWVSSDVIGGAINVVDIFEGGATTISTFRASAVEEIKSELEEVNARLDKWVSNPNMNAGSLGFSAETMVERCSNIGAKALVLQEALGEEMAVLGEMVKIVTERATKISVDAANEVENARNSKRSQAAQARAERDAEREAEREARKAALEAAKAEEAEEDAEVAEQADEVVTIADDFNPVPKPARRGRKPKEA